MARALRLESLVVVETQRIKPVTLKLHRNYTGVRKLSEDFAKDSEFRA